MMMKRYGMGGASELFGDPFGPALGDAYGDPLLGNGGTAALPLPGAREDSVLRDRGAAKDGPKGPRQRGDRGSQVRSGQRPGSNSPMRGG